MNLPEDIKKRFTHIDPCDEKEAIRRKLAKDTETFLVNKGIIKSIKQGVTSEFGDSSIPIGLRKDYIKAHEKIQNRIKKSKEKVTVSRHK